jgi:hypothetical protein
LAVRVRVAFGGGIGHGVLDCLLIIKVQDWGELAGVVGLGSPAGFD